MIALILRGILLLTPLVILIMWLKWRSDSEKNADELQRDVGLLIKRVGILLVIVSGLAITLYFFDGNKGGIDGFYIPPHMENGELVPGQMVDEATYQQYLKDEEERVGGQRF